jgi:hypothetical protein
MLVRHSFVRRSRVSLWVSWALLFSASLLPFGAALHPVLGQSPAAPAKMRAVLYEDDAANPTGAVGTVVWRTERIASAPGRKPEIIVHADIEIPQKLAIRWSIQRSDDRELPGSHLIKIQFTVAADSHHGSVINVPGVMMKTDAAVQGGPLKGISVKVADNFFLIGLSNIELDRKRNAELLQDRSWVDVPMMFGDAKRAVVTFEEGPEGKRALAEALAAWSGGAPK